MAMPDYFDSFSDLGSAGGKNKILSTVTRVKG